MGKSAKDLYEQENIVVLGVNDESPLEKHGGMEIGVDQLTGTFYVHEIMLVVYGVDSIVDACRKYNA